MAKRGSDRPTATTDDFTAEDARGYLSRLVEKFGMNPLPTLSGVCTQVDNLLADRPRTPADAPPGEDPLLGYSIIGRMCGRSPQTIRRWTLEGLLRSEVERPGAPRKIRLSTVKAFFSVGTLDLRELEGDHDDQALRRQGEGGGPGGDHQPERDDPGQQELLDHDQH